MVLIEINLEKDGFKWYVATISQGEGFNNLLCDSLKQLAIQLKFIYNVDFLGKVNLN